MKIEKVKESEFFRLYIGHQKRIYNYILMLVPGIMDAEDILQETMSTMWSKFHEFEKGSNFAAWGRQIARFKVLSYYQAKKHHIAVQFDPEMIERISQYSSSLMENSDDRMFALRKCFQDLDEQDRMIIHMRYVEDKTPKEIADCVDRTVSNIYKHFSRIHNFLLVCVRSKLSQSHV
jgi:RNA polymerase sigma-70 factor (ECF subfamily)